MDDPICSSAGCTQFKHPEEKSHPMNYPVPSFGADPEMETTHNSIAIGEAQFGHKLIMGTDESKAQWKNPAKDTLYNFKPALDHDVKVTASNLPTLRLPSVETWKSNLNLTQSALQLVAPYTSTQNSRLTQWITSFQTSAQIKLLLRKVITHSLLLRSN